MYTANVVTWQQEHNCFQDNRTRFVIQRNETFISRLLCFAERFSLRFCGEAAKGCLGKKTSQGIFQNRSKLVCSLEMLSVPQRSTQDMPYWVQVGPASSEYAKIENGLHLKYSEKHISISAVLFSLGRPCCYFELSGRHLCGYPRCRCFIALAQNGILYRAST